jgi:hypothetical protein
MTYQPVVFGKFLSVLCTSMLLNETVRKSESRASNYRKMKLEYCGARYTLGS